jgi:hypothetical protein
MQNCGVFESLRLDFSLSFDKEVYGNYITSCKIHYYYYYYHHQQQQQQQQQLVHRWMLKVLHLEGNSFLLYCLTTCVAVSITPICLCVRPHSHCSRAGPGRAGPGQAEPSRAEPIRHGKQTYVVKWKHSH